MRLNTIIMALLAIVFGVFAVVLANTWLTSQRNAFANSDPSAEPRRTIVVAAEPLRFGQQLTADRLRAIPWPSNSIPEGAFTTTGELLTGERPREALQAISVNEPILTSKITGEGQRATLSAVLAEGMRAVSIRVNDVLGVAGFVLPGDRVDILLTRRGGERAYVDVLLQGVKVLAVDQLADENKNNPKVVKAVTLEVTAKDAQKLTLAAGVGQLSLALKQIGAGEGELTNRVTMSDLVNSSLESVTPVDDEEDEAAEERPLPTISPRLNTTVGVFRGLDRQVYDVPRGQEQGVD